MARGRGAQVTTKKPKPAASTDRAAQVFNLFKRLTDSEREEVIRRAYEERLVKPRG